MNRTVFIPANTAPGASAGSFSFEYVNKNLSSYDYTITYSGSDIDYIVYDLGGGLTITKTFNYTGKDLTSIVLSGDTPLGISLTKTLTYTGKDLTSVAYS